MVDVITILMAYRARRIMMKKNVLLLFGGCSSEHDVSLKSATTILTNIDKTKFDVYPVGITKEGKWLLYTGNNSDLTSNEWQKNGVSALLSPDATQKALWVFRESTERAVRVGIDVVFPVLHGKNGEDGTIQGLCQLAQIPFVGCGVLASAVSIETAEANTPHPTNGKIGRAHV